MKRNILMCGVLTTVVFLAGCGGINLERLSPLPRQTTLEKIMGELENLENYQAVTEVSYRSNKNINTYTVKQFARSTGQYRTEVIGPEHVAGTILIADGAQLHQINTRLGLSQITAYEPLKDRSILLLTNFIQNKNENTIISEEETITTLHNILENSNNPYLHSQRLVIDNETLRPITLTTYDINDKPRVILAYTEIFFNIPLEESLFLIEP